MKSKNKNQKKTNDLKSKEPYVMTKSMGFKNGK